MSAAAALLHEPFTMYPNRYTDSIKYRLTPTQRDVCDIVIRMCQGWRRESAPISNAMFVSKTGRSIRSIITARSQLINMGLLVIVKKGGGSTTGEYKLDLYYARPDPPTLESPKLDTTPDIESPSDINDDIGVVTEGSTDHVSDTMDVPSITKDDSDIDSTDSDVLEWDSDIVSDSDVITDVPTPQPILQCVPQDTNAPPCIRTDAPLVTTVSSDVHTTSPVVLCEGPVTSVSSDVPTVPSIVLCEPRVTDEVPTSDSILDEPPHQTPSSPPSAPASPTPAMNAPPGLYKDLSIIYINKTETEETEVDNAAHHTSATPDGRKQRTAAHVRYEFTKLFPGAVDNDDWPLFGWAVKSYGVDMCLDKLRLLGEYRKGRPITNPKGLFRMALVNDYQPPAKLMARIRAEESARRAMEESQRRSDEWSTTVANFDYDGAAAALQRLIDTLE